MKLQLKWRMLGYGIALLAAVAYTQWFVRPPTPIEIKVLRENLVVYDGKTMTVQDMEQQLVTLAGREPKRPVQVQVDPNSQSMVLIPVMTAIERSGLMNVQVLTQR